VRRGVHSIDWWKQDASWKKLRGSNFFWWRILKITGAPSSEKSLKLLHIVTFLKLKCTKFDFGWGSAEDPANTLPRHFAGFKGPTSKRREGKKDRRGRKDGRGPTAKARGTGKGRKLLPGADGDRRPCEVRHTSSWTSFLYRVPYC